MIGTLLHQRYKVESVLGEGGMGVVYRAQDTLLQRPVAIKTLAPGIFGDEGARRILREAQSVARLHHPQIVSIFDVISETGSYAIVMEFVEGKTLRELIPAPLDHLLPIAARVLEALEFAHTQGVIHRDIKPENIIIGSDGTAKLMDFGLARSEGRSRLTQTGMIVGTVAYMPPEQALGGQVDARSDLYSLGAVLYEAVTGRPPFESEDPIAVITQHINVPPVAPHWHAPSIPPQLEQVILKLLNKDPTRRFQSAGEVLRALQNVAGAEGAAQEALTATGPDLIQRIARSPLVGRDGELRRFKELVDQTIAGRGGVALITGSLGVGKTRLMEEGATFARLRGAAVITGKAYESAPPYEPFARALRELARGVDSDTLAARLGEFAPEVVGLIPELARQLPRIPERAAGSQEERKNRLFAGVAHFLGASAAQAPVVVLLDDMHLADPGSSELLQHVARRADAARTLIAVGYRPDDLPATPAGKLFGQIVHGLAREAFCTTIPLQPLSAEQVVDLIKIMANHRTRPQRFGQRIYDVTEGNPYFIEEVLKGLFERGALYIKDGQWSTDFDDTRDYSMLEIPSSVHGAVESRLRTLREETRQVLLPAAVTGRQFSFDVLQAVTELSEDALLDRIEEAVRAQLIREVRGAGEDLYEFAQPMLRQVLYDSIPRRRRRLVHRQVGDALERVGQRRLDPYLEALAMHFAEAEDLERTVRYARLAAGKAASVFAYDNAARYL
ncbi:MAG TPA: protein kinase, partial [bacterium]